MDRFLVIGASGFVGGHLFRFLKKQANCEVIGTRSQSIDDELAHFDLERDSIHNCVPSAWLKAGPDKWALLCSAVVPMDRCVTEPAKARSVMLDGTQRCIDQLAATGFTPVFLSTSYVFDGRVGGYREDDPTDPQSRYGMLKLQIEHYLQATYPQALVVRLDKIVGTDLSGRHLFADWYQLASNEQAICCIADQEFGPTLVDDIATGLYQACLAKLRGCYHLANPEPISRTELARRFLDACRKHAEIRSVPLTELNLAEPRPMSSWLNSDKIQSTLGVRFTPIEDILQRLQSPEG